MAFGPILYVILIAIVVLALIGLGIYWLVVYFKEHERHEDEPLFINFMPSLTNGHAIGTIKKVVDNQVFNRKRIYFEPKDVKPLDIWKKSWKTQDIVVENE